MSRPDPRPAGGDKGDKPSWPRVIATTVQLWLQRRVLRRPVLRSPVLRDQVLRDQVLRDPGQGEPGAPAGRRPGSRRRAGIFGLVIVVFAAGALTIALTQGRNAPAAGHRADRPGIDHPEKLSTAALAAAAANRQQAAAWIAAQVGHSIMVSCDPVMCAALEAHDFPAGDLLALNASANDPMGSQVVVSTTALRDQFGSRLPDVYAPVVIATFGAGATRVDVRVEAADGSQAYLVSQRADLLARQAAGHQLLHNKRLHVSGAWHQALAAGSIDSRVLMTLAALTAQLGNVHVTSFGDSGPGAAADVPLRMVQISAPVSKQGGRSASYLHSVLKFLRAQRAPFLASTTVLHPHGTTIIQIQFAAPSPLGLLGGHTSP